KVYSLHAPEVECIGKGKAHQPYEFGVKVSVATPMKHSAGGQFVTHAAALPGNPYDGHTLATVIPQMQGLIGNVLDRCITDAGYRGHNTPFDYKFKACTGGQKRRVTPQIKREFKRRAAIEPVIGHLKEHHRMGRNYLAHASGDAINVVLAAAGYNFRRLLAWLRFLLLRILTALGLAANGVLHGRLLQPLFALIAHRRAGRRWSKLAEWLRPARPSQGELAWRVEPMVAEERTAPQKEGFRTLPSLPLPRRKSRLMPARLRVDA